MPRSCTEPPCLCGALGIFTAALFRFPERDSSRQVPSTCQDMEGPVLKGCRPFSITSHIRILMNQDVLRETWQAAAHALRLPPACSILSTYSPQVSGGSLERARSPIVFLEKVLPQPLQSHLCEPSLPCPLRTKSADPHLGHAAGASPAPNPSSLATAALVASISLRLSPGVSSCISWSIVSIILFPACWCSVWRLHHTRGAGQY